MDGRRRDERFLRESSRGVVLLLGLALGIALAAAAIATVMLLVVG